MATIVLYEYEPTRSLKCRWILQEAGLEYESKGNDVSIIGSDELKSVQPLGKLPAVLIDGEPLFEASAIVTKIADMVPEKNLIAKPGSWERALHDQWMCFAHAELECWAWTGLLNSRDFLLPEEQHIPQAVIQAKLMFQRAAAALEQELSDKEYIIGNRFSATDIIISYCIYLGRFSEFVDETTPNLHSYLARMYEREHCTFAAPE